MSNTFALRLPLLGFGLLWVGDTGFELGRFALLPGLALAALGAYIRGPGQSLRVLLLGLILIWLSEASSFQLWLLPDVELALRGWVLLICIAAAFGPALWSLYRKTPEAEG